MQHALYSPPLQLSVARTQHAFYLCSPLRLALCSLASPPLRLTLCSPPLANSLLSILSSSPATHLVCDSTSLVYRRMAVVQCSWSQTSDLRSRFSSTNFLAAVIISLIVGQIGKGTRNKPNFLAQLAQVVNWVAMDDPFHSSVNLEEIHFKEGYDEGYSHGLVSGKDEGKQVGLKVGFEVGEELGFYSGCIHIWTSAIQVDATCFSSRAKTVIAQMQDLINKYPLMDPEDLQVQEIMDTLRLKFKMLCSSLHIKLHYNDYLVEGNKIQF